MIERQNRIHHARLISNEFKEGGKGSYDLRPNFIKKNQAIQKGNQ